MTQIAPHISEWLKANKECTLNDYFRENPPKNDDQVIREINNLRTDIMRNHNLAGRKNVFTSFFLTLFFGVFGLFYSSVSTALWMMLLPIFGLMVGFALPFICQETLMESVCLLSMNYWAGYIIFLLIHYPLCLIFSITKVMSHNKSLG